MGKAASMVNSPTMQYGQAHIKPPHLPKRLRLLSYNIQCGIPTKRFHHYITRSWQHFLPDVTKMDNLKQIANLLHQYDIVALQEADAGSVRSSYLNQVQYLAARAGFPYWHQQINRNLGRFAQHSNGILSKYEPNNIKDYRLPSRIPGRGAIVMELGNPAEPLAIFVMHLSLGKRARWEQLAYISSLINQYQHVVLLGDLNAPMSFLIEHSPLSKTHLRPASSHYTFPSWRPRKDIDHVLVSPSLIVNSTLVLPHQYSDHLPLAIDISLPDQIIDH